MQILRTNLDTDVQIARNLFIKNQKNSRFSKKFYLLLLFGIGARSMT